MTSTEEHLAIHRAFGRAWRTLLREERVTAANIDIISLSLLQGILDAVATGERNELVLMAAGLRCTRDHATEPRRNKEGSSLH